MLAFLLLGLSLLQVQEARIPDPNPLELNHEIRAFIDRKVDKSLAPTERLRALANAVFRDEELRFAYASETRTAIETFEHRGGNCLSFTFLFVAMARYLDLDARFQEVEIAPVWSNKNGFFNLSRHINAAVFIGPQGYVVDVYPGVHPIVIGGSIVKDERALAHFYNNRGVSALESGDLETSEYWLRKAADTDPTAGCVWVNLGVEQAKAGKTAEAAQYYRKAMEIDRDDPAAMSNMAALCQQTGRHKEAAYYLKKVREFREKNPYHHYALGLQAFEEEKYEESVAHYKKALKLKAKEHNFYFALARSYAALNRLDEVIKNLELAQKYAPDGSKNRYNRKLELLQAGLHLPKHP